MHKKNVAVLISGNGSNLQALLDACADAHYPARIVLVLSNKADAYGLVRATQAGVPTQVIAHGGYADRAEYDAALHAAIVESGADLVCLAGFMRLLTPAFVEQWSGRMLNIHPSLLPAFKGLDTHARAIASGACYSGCTVHFVVPEMDAGPIITQKITEISDDDTPESLAQKIHTLEHVAYVEALQWLASERLQVAGNRVRLLPE